MRQRTSNRTKKRPAVGALDAGLRLLGRRAHSRVELQRKLSRRGHAPEEVDSALDRLNELGYLDDRSFAEGLVRRRGAIRGPMALSAELAARGVDRAEADAAVAGFQPAQQLAAATRLAERLYARKAPASLREMLDSVGAKLRRRGFSSSVVRAACQRVLTGTSYHPED